ncbi:glycosyl hydrolase family 95 catalytic domain-containing protein [Streptacidiphilus albus]|uniref:glycosyl hydrolase family 95 catalytic domain-containing protein n=1 Tax=Streptacidiphilus albus TaxID=105425 RepID=UPI000A914EB3|nr:RICIN domain-containing protein [Streptacidiphilus albus]
MMQQDNSESNDSIRAQADATPPGTSRRALLRSGAVLGVLMAAGVLPALPSRALPSASAASSGPVTLVPPSEAVTMWYEAAGSEASIMQQGLPIGNGRLGALTTGDSANDAIYLTDGTFWQGTANTSLDGSGDGQFPYDSTDFGSFGQLAAAHLSLPTHTASAIGGYQRQLDLSNGFASVTYQLGSASYRRDVYASHPDDVVVIHLTQTGGGTYSGSLSLAGTHSESVAADSTLTGAVSFTGTLSTGGEKYAAIAAAAVTGGTVSTSGSSVAFANCSEVVLVLSAGTDYSPTATGYLDSTITPLTVARSKAQSALARSGATLLNDHVADYQALAGAMTVNLGQSTAAQNAMSTDARLAARSSSGTPDPQLEASYLMLGRYLAITGSRTALPMGLQGLWINNDDPSWFADYHTDINLQMNYWLPDRTGVPSCFQAFADYCLAQLPAWETRTQTLFNSSQNGFRNSSGKIAGFTVAISMNPYGGFGWWWHPAGGAWLANSLYDHYLYTQDATYLSTIYPLLKSACQFWQARLISTTWTDANNVAHTVLVDDADWSPEHGPSNAIGITYAQELVWQLFQNYQQAAATLGQDSSFAATIAGLQSQLYLPQVSSVTGWLEEWMTPQNLDTSDIQHRHLSPLVGLFPGDRITADQSPAALLTGVTNLLTARGMQSFGWAVAWRSLCWARLKNAASAYQELVYQLTPSVNGSNGTAINFFDIYADGSSTGVFQIDANFGMPSAMVEMLLYSRPGYLQLLPALPTAWAASGHVTGMPARGGFTVDFSWTDGQATSATVRNIGPASAGTLIVVGTWSQQVTVPAGGSVTVTPAPTLALPTQFILVNRDSGLAVEDPGSSASAGTLLAQNTPGYTPNQTWNLVQASGAAPGVHDIVNVGSGLGMNVEDGSTAPDQPIIQWPIQGGRNEQWTVASAGGGYVTVTSVLSGLVLGVAGAATSTGAGIQQQTPNGSTSQQWLMSPTTFCLVNRNSGLVLEDPGSSTSAGTLLAQNTKTGAANQHWQLKPASGAAAGVFDIVNVASGLGMNVEDGASAPDQPIIQWPIQGGRNEQWTVASAGGGYVTVTSVLSGLVLGVAGAATSTGAGIQQQTPNGSTSQQWLMSS